MVSCPFGHSITICLKSVAEMMNSIFTNSFSKWTSNAISYFNWSILFQLTLVHHVVPHAYWVNSNWNKKIYVWLASSEFCKVWNFHNFCGNEVKHGNNILNKKKSCLEIPQTKLINIYWLQLDKYAEQITNKIKQIM